MLDEPSEGTIYKERLETSVNVLDGFYRKEATTILITHNHQLVDEFINQQTVKHGRWNLSMTEQLYQDQPID